jgi:hypothetical protein
MRIYYFTSNTVAAYLPALCPFFSKQKQKKGKIEKEGDIRDHKNIHGVLATAVQVVDRLHTAVPYQELHSI